jgi:hypothetical protein
LLQCLVSSFYQDMVGLDKDKARESFRKFLAQYRQRCTTAGQSPAVGEKGRENLDGQMLRALQTINEALAAIGEPQILVRSLLRELPEDDGVMIDRSPPDAPPPPALGTPEDFLTQAHENPKPSASEELLPDDFLLQPPTGFEVHPFLREDGPIAELMKKAVATRAHPFAEVVEHDGAKFLVVLTMEGTFRSGPHKGKKGTVAFKVKADGREHRHIYHLPEDILFHIAGNQVMRQEVCEDGWTRKLWVLHYKPKMKIRFWLNVQHSLNDRKDDPNGNRAILLDPEKPAGWVLIDPSMY